MVIHANKHSRREITPAIPKKTVSMKLGIVLFIFAKVIKKRTQNIVFFIFKKRILSIENQLVLLLFL